MSVSPDYLRDINIVSMLLRFLLAALGGGIIGLSRGRRQHAAGLRTHLLVCIGSASVMITSQYFVAKMGMPGDIVRMPAQVISGIGVLGAGSIIVTGKKHVSGLTTAAGLWASACMGLAAGAGYYECAVVLCLLIYIVLVSLNRWDETRIKASRVLTVYIETLPETPLSAVLSGIKSLGLRTNSVEALSQTPGAPGYMLEVEIIEKALSRQTALAEIDKLPDVAFSEELNG